MNPESLSITDAQMAGVRAATGAMEAEGSIIFRVTPEEIEAKSTTRLVSFLHPEVRGNVGLGCMMGNITMDLPRTNTLHGEPFLCNTTRLFCQELYREFPFWGFFFGLNSMALWKMTLGTLQNTSVLQHGRACDTKFLLNDDEIQSRIMELVQSLLELGRVAGIPEQVIVTRETALRDYFSRLMAAHCAGSGH